MAEGVTTETVQKVEDAAPSSTNGDGKQPESPVEDVGMDDSEEDKKLRACRQIEFYFADSNLPYDRFMWTLHTANDEHWVPISTVASFKRMREFASLGLPWIVDALKKSEELEIDSAEEKVRRRSEVKPPAGLFERSIYAKGFGEEDPTLQKKLEAFFNKYGQTSAVRMRRDKDKKFKGSVFVEFADIKSVDKFLKTEPKPTWNGEGLVIMTKEAYCEMKIKEKGLTGKAAIIRRNEAASAPNPRGFNAFREMEKAHKGGNTTDEKKPEVWLEFMGTKIRVLEKEDGDKEGYVNEEDVPYVKGSALKFSGCGGDVPWGEIKDPLKERFTRPPFIKYERGEDSGLVGFDRALTEEDISFVKEKVKTLGGKTIEWTAADESEERQFLIERAQTAAKRAISGGSRGGRGGARGGGRGGRGGGRGGRGGRGGGRGRGAGRGGNQREAKVAAEKKENGSAATTASAETGEKRKRAIEPDGGPDVGTRGVGVPTIQAAKKPKTDAS